MEIHQWRWCDGVKQMLVNRLKLKKHKIKANKKSQYEPKICVSTRWAKCCECFVQVQLFNDELVIFKGSKGFAREEIKLDVDDILVFEYQEGLQAQGLQVHHLH